MREKILSVCKWLVPACLLILGAVFCFALSGHSFLGILCWGLALLLGIYRLLSAWEKKQRMPAKLLRTVLSVLVIFGLLAAAFTLVPILKGGPGGECRERQYVVVLGAGLRGSEPSRILQDRIDRAYEYLLSDPDVICIASGGQGADEEISEAQCIFEQLTARGIPSERIWLEDRSTSTAENIRFTLELLEKKTGSRPRCISVISNEFHLYRVSLVAKDSGVEAHCVPAETSRLSLRLNYTLREIVTLWKYLILGG